MTSHLAAPIASTSAERAVGRAWQLLAGIVDPEIPAISIVDLGIVGDVRRVGHRLEIELLPTFIGCPALELVQATIIERLEPLRRDPGLAIEQVAVRTSYAQPWTAERISPAGRAALRASGFAPPGLTSTEALPPRATCPYCGSRRTVLENAFGPTRCRSIHYCTDCRQPFEQFKDG
ncbi:MAG TPA: 1,2-phenylacetyl-CoA epoxidase subunit PaaD [Candidatus Limnocylindrales bacterium]